MLTNLYSIMLTKSFHKTRINGDDANNKLHGDNNLGSNTIFQHMIGSQFKSCRKNQRKPLFAPTHCKTKTNATEVKW